MTYRIRDWNQLFENNRTRELKRMDWVPIPNKMDGEGYTTLMDHPNAAAHFGAWVAILEIASRRDPRGTLPQVGAEIPQALARISRIPVQVFEEVLPRLVKLQWIEQLGEIPQDGAEKPQVGAEECLRARVTEGNGMEGNGMEGKENGNARTPAVTRQRFQEWIRPWPRNPSEERALHAFVFAWTAESDSEIFACRDRYLKSADVADGICQNPEKFLNEQKQNKWAGKWPMPTTKLNGKQPSLTDRTKALWADRIAKGERPI